MKERGKNLDMTQGEPAKLLILFAIPMLIGGIFQLMYNMVDTVVVGRFVNVNALAAIGATSSTTSLILFVGQSMTNAASVIISQAEGAKRQDYVRKAVAHTLYIVIASSVFLGALSLFGARPMMTLLGTPGNIIDMSVLYIQITGGLTVASIAYNGVSAILRAIGDSKTPLYFLIFCSLLNVGLDLLFVLQFGMGVDGVAWATVISQGLSAVACTFYMLKKYPRLRPDRDAWRFDPDVIKEFFSIGLPLCLQNLVLGIGMFVITAVINSFGSSIVAAYTIGNKTEQLATVSFSNIAFSFSVYAGQNFGAKKYQRIRDGLKKGLLIVSGMALLSTLVMWLFATPLAGFFMDTPDPAVLEGAVSMIHVEATLYIALGAIWTVNSTLRGIGCVKITLVSCIVELVSKIGFSVCLPLFLGYVGIWMAAPIGWVLGLIPSLFYLIHWFRKAIPPQRIERAAE